MSVIYTPTIGPNFGRPTGAANVTAIGTVGDTTTTVADLVVTDDITLADDATFSDGVAVGAASSTTAVLTVTSKNANALAVGRQGATAPALKVDSSATSSATGVEIVSAAAASGVNLRAISSGTDESIAVNAKGAGTVTIGDVSTGAITLTRATSASSTLAVTGAITPTGGVAAAGGFAVSGRLYHSGSRAPLVSTDGTDATPVATEVYFAEVIVSANVTLTGVSNFNGSVASGNIKVGLANSSGVVVATSASTAMSGTDAYQRVPFTATYAAKGPATYYILLFVDNNTARVNCHTFGDFVAGKQTGQVFATGFTTITPGTSFTTALGPMASLY